MTDFGDFCRRLSTEFEGVDVSVFLGGRNYEGGGGEGRKTPRTDRQMRPLLELPISNIDLRREERRR